MNVTITDVSPQWGVTAVQSAGAQPSQANSVSLVVAVPGSIAGPIGPQGPAGPQGPTGFPGDQTFIFTQSVPAATWVVAHNLGKFPSVAVVDSGGTVVEGDLHYDSLLQLTLSFVGVFAGVAYCD